MSLSGRLARIEKARVQAALEAFRQYWQRRERDPAVSAAMAEVVRRMGEVETAVGHRITLAEWLDNEWMAGHGLVKVLDRLIAAVYAGDGR
jgi:hypothetical protein